MAPDRLASLLGRQRAFQRSGGLSIPRRRELLASLARAIETARGDIEAALAADFGKPPHETVLTEILPVLAEIRLARRRVRRWNRTRRVPTPAYLLPATSRVEREPWGVVGVIAPWNYPFALCVQPAVSAIAAGNSVLLKPSELAPHIARVVTRLVADAFPPEIAAVLNGGPDVAQAIAAAPLDYLFYTGSPRVGRLVMEAAARNLVPLTLELGGKSPAIVLPGADIERAAGRVVWGKLVNAGQTCVAPDYALVPEAQVPAFIDAVRAWARARYEKFTASPDFARIVSDRHVKRLRGLLAEAVDGGAAAHWLRETDSGKGKHFPPVIVTGLKDSMALAQEEIFGPILPVIGYTALDEALARVASGSPPLACYVLGEDRAAQDRVLRAVRCGGACVNGTILHLANFNLPFGGVGTSGMGQYHGEFGFKTFTRERAVLRVKGGDRRFEVMRPPYKPGKVRMLRRLLRWL